MDSVKHIKDTLRVQDERRSRSRPVRILRRLHHVAAYFLWLLKQMMSSVQYLLDPSHRAVFMFSGIVKHGPRRQRPALCAVIGIRQRPDDPYSEQYPMAYS